MSVPWWVREGRDVRSGRLFFGGRDAGALAREHGTPLFVYDGGRAEANLRRLRSALERSGPRHRLLYAVKANRHPDLLARIRRSGLCGVDVSSPGEIDLALGAGFRAEEISYTGTNLSGRDLDRILAHPVILNLDALSAIRRVGERAPGRRIGLRVNPGIGAGFSPQLTYSGERPTKFGIYPDQIDDALLAARRGRLEVRGLHFHIGSGWLRDGLPTFLEAARRAAAVARRLPGIEYVNVGGGIGARLAEADREVDLDAYAAGLREILGPLGATVYCEPGDFVMRDAGVLLVEVTGVDVRGGVTFVGVDCGFNAYPLNFIYRYPQTVVLCRAADAPPRLRATVAGHINEAGDLFAEDCDLPEAREGDILALLNTGGYGAAMASEHCARPHAREIVVT